MPLEVEASQLLEPAPARVALDTVQQGVVGQHADLAVECVGSDRLHTARHAALRRPAPACSGAGRLQRNGRAQAVAFLILRDGQAVAREMKRGQLLEPGAANVTL